jgi:chromosome segregation ATPase
MNKQGNKKTNNAKGPKGKQALDEEQYRAPDSPDQNEGEGMVIEFQHPLLDHFMDKADQLGRDHDQHTSEAVNRIEDYERTQEDYKNLVEDNIVNHDERRRATEQIIEHSRNFEAYTKDSAKQKRDLRAEFDDLEDALRKLKDQISETEIENKNLQLIAETEQSIQDAKDRAEQDAINAVNRDLKELVSRLAADSEADISYQEVSERIKGDVEGNLAQSRSDFEVFLRQTDIARGELSEDLRELKDRANQRNQDNDELRAKIEEGEIETDRLNREINNLSRDIDDIRRANEDTLRNLERDRESNEVTIADLRKTAEDLRVEHSKLEVGIMKINSQLQYLDEAGKSGGNDLIRKKIELFDGVIRSTDRNTEQLKTHLNGMNRDWIARIESANRELSNLIRDSESKNSSDKINQLLQELQAKQTELEELKRRRNQIERELASTDPEGTEKEITALRSELDDVNARLIAILRENNKAEIARLRMEIEYARREQEEKGAFFEELLAQIDDRRRMLEELQDEIANNEHIMHELELTLQARKDEGDELDRLLAERDDEIRRLEARLEELNKNRPKTPEPVIEPEPVYNEPEEPVSYVAASGDEVDQLLAMYINKHSCPVPITRLGGGYYLFGTRKIYAKIMNGRLVIRVGGGYMIIDEFIETYAEVELKKMESRRARGLEAIPDVSDNSPSNRSYGSPTNKASPGRGSPKTKTMKASSPSGTYLTGGASTINGTSRQKNFGQSQIDKALASGAARKF